MNTKQITLTNGQVKAVYEYFSDVLSKDGENATYSYMVYKNAEILANAYNKVVSDMYVDATNTRFQEYAAKARELVTQFADRDEQGNIIHADDNQNMPRITVQIAEFNVEAAKLDEEYKDMLDDRTAKIEATKTMLSQAVEYTLFVCPLNQFPNAAAPGIVGLFAENV